MFTKIISFRKHAPDQGHATHRWHVVVCSRLCPAAAQCAFTGFIDGIVSALLDLHSNSQPAQLILFIFNYNVGASPYWQTHKGHQSLATCETIIESLPILKMWENRDISTISTDFFKQYNLPHTTYFVQNIWPRSCCVIAIPQWRSHGHEISCIQRKRKNIWQNPGWENGTGAVKRRLL